MIAFYVTICLWSWRAPECNTQPIDVYQTHAACVQDDEAFSRWFDEAKDVYKFKGMSGDGYSIKVGGCAPYVAPQGDPDDGA